MRSSFISADIELNDSFCFICNLTDGRDLVKDSLAFSEDIGYDGRLDQDETVSESSREDA
jgi:hypothetical protein